MPNQNGNAYGLTTLCPLLPASGRDASPTALIRDFLNDEPTDENSPMAKVPNTYLCRFFVLEDVVYQGKPAEHEHLRSKYLVFIASFHGSLEEYLTGMWENAQEFVKRTWQYCAGWKGVDSAAKFVAYIKKCQVETTFFFNGSTDEPLAEQLKSLYLKQEFSKFAYENQGRPAAQLQHAFQDFIGRVRPFEVSPTWRAGASTLEAAGSEA